MKLSMLYANKVDFKPLIFNEGFNVIYGNVENVFDEKTNKVQVHNLGKTSLVYLIDFLLLKEIDKNSIFKKYQEKFADWVFFLEIKLNNGEYLTIRRAVNPSSKISFKKHLAKHQNFANETHWDYEDLSITTKDKNKNPKIILHSTYLKFDVGTDYNYRKFLSYLLRTQNDYRDVFRMDGFRGKDKDWKPALFTLLGFDSSMLTAKYELDNDITEDKKHIKKLQSKHEDSEIYKIRGVIEAKEQERVGIQKEMDVFDFYKKEQNINFDLVKNIETQISELNNKRYALDCNIEKIKQSLDVKNKPSIQMEEIKQLYKEAKIYFSDSLLKNYDEVLNFSLQITKEREKYLEEELDTLEDRHKTISSTLKNLNKQRSELLSLLKEKDTFQKYKKYQEDLAKIEGEIYNYKLKLKGAETIEQYQESIDRAKEQIKQYSESIKKEINKDNPDYQEIKRIFQEIYRKTFEYTAILIVAPNKSGNVEFDADVLSSSQDLTGKAEGYTSTKILCASFILAILTHYSSRSFFKFAYHDGIIESWGDNHKIHFIELVRQYCDEYGIQYIMSMIKSDIPQNFQIQDNEKIRVLSNRDLLFGFQF